MHFKPGTGLSTDFTELSYPWRGLIQPGKDVYEIMTEWT